jgi:hypothetical protein
MKLGIWTGIETDDKPLSELVGIARAIRNYGADAWFLRVGYGGILKVPPTWCTYIRTATGIELYPWFYSYGTTYQPGERQNVGLYIASNWQVTLDVEDEWFTQDCSIYKNLHLFGVTSYANPQDNGKGMLWHNLSKNFTCDYFFPQVYTAYNAQVWKNQYSGYACIPIVTPATLAQATGQKCTCYWEYQDCIQENMTYLLSVLQKEDTTAMDKQFTDSWYATGIPAGTGIYKAVLAKYQSGVILGIPLSKEIHTIDWHGAVCIIQYFSYGHVAWYPDGTHHGYTTDDQGSVVQLW